MLKLKKERMKQVNVYEEQTRDTCYCLEKGNTS